MAKCYQQPDDWFSVCHKSKSSGASSLAGCGRSSCFDSDSGHFLGLLVKPWTEPKHFFDREILPAWRGRRLSEITKADVRKLVDGIAKRPAPISANGALASIKTFFAFAVEQDSDGIAAAAIKPPAPETAREGGDTCRL
jgi:hypothetical protein